MERKLETELEMENITRLERLAISSIQILQENVRKALFHYRHTVPRTKYSTRAFKRLRAAQMDLADYKCLASN